MAASNFRQILRVLVDHGVEFVVVGGVSAVLQGAPVNTFDLDVVHSTEATNIAKLRRALGEISCLDAESPLRARGSVGDRAGYRELVGEADRMDIGDGLSLAVLNLVSLIRVKEATAGEKDNAMRPILKRTLAERGKK